MNKTIVLTFVLLAVGSTSGFGDDQQEPQMPPQNTEHMSSSKRPLKSQYGNFDPSGRAYSYARAYVELYAAMNKPLRELEKSNDASREKELTDEIKLFDEKIAKLKEEIKGYQERISISTRAGDPGTLFDYRLETAIESAAAKMKERKNSRLKLQVVKTRQKLREEFEKGATEGEAISEPAPSN